MKVELNDITLLIKYRRDFLEKTLVREKEVFKESENKKIDDLISIKQLEEAVKQLNILLSELPSNVNSNFINTIKDYYGVR